MNDRPITSPSNFFRRKLCPGSEAAELGAPEEVSSDAQSGTLLHYYDANPNADVEEISQTEILERNRKLREKYLDFILERLGIPADARRKEVVEQEYYLRDENGEIVLGPDGKPFCGHPDRLLYFPDYRVLLVFDSKFGRKVVPAAESNYQIRLYCIMAADPDFGDFEATRVFGAITQPLATPQLHAVEYDQASLRDAKTECLRILRSLRTATEAPRHASADACRYCRAKASCSTALALVKKAAAEKISELPIPELEALAPMMELAESIVEAYWIRLKYIAEHFPHLLQKLELKPGADVGEISSEDSTSAYSKLASAGLVNADDYTSACKPSITKLSESIAKKQKISVKDARFRLEATLGELIKRKRRAPSLVEKKPKQLPAP